MEVAAPSNCWGVERCYPQVAPLHKPERAHKYYADRSKISLALEMNGYTHLLYVFFKMEFETTVI